MPDLDFSISLHDAGPPSASRWVLDRKDEDLGKAWLAPDFGLWSWPEPWVGGWRDFRCRAAEVEREMTWATKEDVLVRALHSALCFRRLDRTHSSGEGYQ